jgi:hypothetical protein
MILPVEPVEVDSMTITGEAYYEPAADLSLKDEVVK